MPTVKHTILIIVILIGTITSNISAGLFTFDPGTVITDTSQWTAGTGLTEQWYGSNFTASDGYAELTETSLGNTSMLARTGVNSILFALELSSGLIGTHNWHIDSLFSDYDTQYNYGQVFLLNIGQILKLNKDIWNKPPLGASLISSQQALPGSDNLNWNTYGSTYDISQNDVDTFNYIVFAFTGSKHTSQVMMFDNFSPGIYENLEYETPEPATVAIAGLGLLLLFRKTAHPVKKSNNA